MYCYKKDKGKSIPGLPKPVFQAYLNQYSSLPEPAFQAYLNQYSRPTWTSIPGLPKPVFQAPLNQYSRPTWTSIPGLPEPVFQAYLNQFPGLPEPVMISTYIPVLPEPVINIISTIFQSYLNQLWYPLTSPFFTSPNTNKWFKWYTLLKTKNCTIIFNILNKFCRI